MITKNPRAMGSSAILDVLVDAEIGTHLHVRDYGSHIFSVLVKRAAYTWVNIDSGTKVAGRQLSLAIVRYNAEWVLS